MENYVEPNNNHGIISLWQLMLNKLQQKVTKLQSSLDLQMHMQTELESELKEKNKEIDARGNEVSTSIDPKIWW